MFIQIKIMQRVREVPLHRQLALLSSRSDEEQDIYKEGDGEDDRKDNCRGFEG